MKKKDIPQLIEILNNTYPDAECSLNFNTPFELAVAVLLSAQCTDERVNKVVPPLFKDYPTVYDIAKMDLETLESYIKSCGFYKNKSKNILAMSNLIVSKFNGVLPDNMDDLMTLPGIGRKSANVIMLNAFNNPQGIAVDTHAKRISNRLELSKESDPIKIEQDLLKIFPKKYLKDINHLFVYHGRKYCTAIKPKCNECPISSLCKFHTKITL